MPILSGVAIASRVVVEYTTGMTFAYAYSQAPNVRVDQRSEELMDTLLLCNQVKWAWARGPRLALYHFFPLCNLTRSFLDPTTRLEYT